MTDNTVQIEGNETVPEFMEDVVDDLGYVPRNKRLGLVGRLKLKQNAKWLSAITFCGLVLIIVLTMAFDNEENSLRETEDSPAAGLARIEARLDALEAKLTLMENNARSGPDERKGRPTSNTANRYHTVRPGDTLSAIAGKYGATVDSLCKWNRLTVTTPIRPGQKLLVYQR